MSIKSKGRGTAATFGLLLLFAGAVGALFLYAASVRRPGQTIDGFARAPVGCTTRMEFSDVGAFYVFEEVGGVVTLPEGECVPTSTPGAPFAVEIAGPATVDETVDESLTYDDDGRVGSSRLRIDIDQPGQYAVSVDGRDPAIVAAIGRDPDDGVDDLRRQAITVGVIGITLGLVLLLLAGWRSKKAATYAVPDGPGWGARRATTAGWTPEGPRTGQRPVNPQQPDEPVSVATDPPPLPARAPAARSPWEPPAPDAAVDRAPPEPPPPPPPVPTPTPTLPNTPGRPSGVSPDAAPPADREDR